MNETGGARAEGDVFEKKLKKRSMIREKVRSRRCGFGQAGIGFRNSSKKKRSLAETSGYVRNH
jgi:hypothetical protein